MGKHLYKLFFGALMFVAAAAFTGCADDETEITIPELSASVATLDFAPEAQDAQTVEVKANCDWTIKADNLAWATILVDGQNTIQGSGNATLSISVEELPANLTMRRGVISFDLVFAMSGSTMSWGQADATITVTQKDDNVIIETDPIYFNNFDKEVAEKTYGSGSSWPYADQFEGWKNEEGLGAANVTYETSGVSIRANSGSDSNYSDYKGSGSNNIFFGTNAYITIQNIDVTGKTNYELSFGTERYLNDDKDKPEGNTFRHEEFEVTLSNDGNAWSAPLNYTFAAGVDPNGRWDLATSKFTLPEGTTTLYIRFVSKIASGHRLDDVKLVEGMGGGDVISFEGSDTPGGPDDPEPLPGDAIYTNDFDKEAVGSSKPSDGWPYADETDIYKNESGAGAANVTYETSGVSVRGNSTSDGTYSDYAGSGQNNMFFGKDAYFTIQNITVEDVNFRLSFGADRYSQGANNVFNHNDFVVELSNNGTNWSAPLTYAFAKGTDPDGRWDLAIADFTLPEGTTVLYIRFTSKVASVHRLDDVSLVDGSGGQKVSFDGQTPPEVTPGESITMTIPELVAACKGKTEQTVLNAEKDVVFEGVVVTDKEGGNWSSNNLAVMTEGATTAENGILLYGSGITNPGDESYDFVPGDKIKVTLKAGLARLCDYQGCYELTGSQGEKWVTIEKIGTATVTPVEITCEQLAKFQYMPVTLKNVTSPATAAAWSGTQTFTQNGNSFTVYTAKGAAWVEEQFKAGVTGDLSGMVTLYRGAAQVAPRNLNDIAAFVEGGVTPEPEPEPEDAVKINTITAAGDYKTVGTVVAAGKMAYMIADETGAMMVYHKDNTRKVGEKIVIEGAVTIYNATSTPQFSADATVEVLSEGNSWTYNPVVKDGAAMDAMLTGDIKVQEIQFDGSLVVDGNFVNVTIEGASTAIGSVKYLDNSTLSGVDGKNVTVKGYFVGISSGKYVNVLPYSVTEVGGTTPDPDQPENPDTPAEGDACLTADDIAAICTAMGKENAYMDFSYEGWSGFGSNNKGNGIQLNNNRVSKGTKAAHIKTPVFASNAKKVTVVATSSSGSARNIGIYAADVDVTKELAAEATTVAVSDDKTGKDQQHTFTVDLSGKNLKEFVIYTTKGALIIHSVAVELE